MAGALASESQFAFLVLDLCRVVGRFLDSARAGDALAYACVI